MDLAIVVYLIGLLSAVSGVSIVIAVGLSILIPLYAFICYSEDIEINKKALSKVLKWLLIPCFVLTIFLPSKTDMYIMTGLIVGEKVLTSEKGNELVDKSYLYVLTKIDEAIEEQAEGESNE